MISSPDHSMARRSMFWRLWWRAISVKRPQAALALGSLVVGATISSMLLNLYGDVRRKMREEFRAYGANVVIAPASAVAAGAAAASGVADEGALRPLSEFARHTPGTIAVPVLYGVVRVSREPADPRLPEFENAVAVGAEFGAARRLNSGWRVAGETVLGDLPAGACAVGSHLAARLHVQRGDSLGLEPVGDASQAKLPLPEKYRIAIVLETGASEDEQVFLPLASLQSLLGMSGKVSLVELSVPGETREVERSVERLAGLLPGLEVRPIRQIVYSEGKVLRTLRWLLLSLTVVILVIIALCLTATMTAIVLERRKDIGVMKALGAADGLLVRLFMMEGAGLGLAGGVAGFCAGALVAHSMELRLFGVALSVSWWTLPVVCCLTVALAVLAAQVPVRIVRSIQPAVVLKGE
ncbi:MAG: FtsX-like permease family protein [Terriglobia bacterium]